MIKRIVVITCIFSCLVSCKSHDPSPFIGTWIDQETEMIQLTITRDDEGIFWVESHDNKYEVVENQKVIIGNKEYPLEFNSSRNLFKLGGKTYIPTASSVNDKFLGNWRSEEGTLFEISNVNGGLKWVITKEGSDLETNYYPKKTENGFVFTYLGENVKFCVVNGCIEDSNGNKYCKIS